LDIGVLKIVGQVKNNKKGKQGKPSKEKRYSEASWVLGWRK